MADDTIAAGVPEFDPGMFPHGRRTIGQLILDHNPCFLFSTLLMLLGCYLLNSALDVRAGDGGKLFGLLAVINVYEVCIIALGLLLVRRRSSPARDGMWLLLFETLFLVDGTFLIAETVEANPAWGWLVNVVLLVLAVVKGLVVLRGMRVRLGAKTAGFLVLQLAVVYVLPIVLQRAAVDGVVSARVMNGVWWVVGLLPLAYELLARLEPAEHLGTVQQAVRRAYVIIPWLLAVAHAGFMHWAYHADFYAADLAPVLLGASVASLRVGGTGARRGESFALLRVLFPFAAVVVALRQDSQPLEWLIGTLRITPLELALPAALIVWAYFVSAWAAAGMAAVLLLAAGLYWMREWIDEAMRWTVRMLGIVEGWLESLLPQTAAAWGVWAIGGAFVLLAAGGLVSLRRERLPEKAAGAAEL